MDKLKKSRFSNAMVAIFLRQVHHLHVCSHPFARYFRGIMFLTTNHIKTFDQAFQSRIHVGLRRVDLPAEEQIWRAFLDKVRTQKQLVWVELHDNDLRALSAKDMNGR